MLIESVMPSNHLILCHSLLLQPSIFPASRYFPMSQLSASCGQSTGASASASVHPMNIQDSFPLGLTAWFLCSKRDTKDSSPLPQLKIINYSVFSFLYDPLSDPYMTTGKTITLARSTIVGKVMSLLFNMLSSFCIAFLSRRIWISWLQSSSSVIWEPKKIKTVTVSTVSPSICHEVMGPDAMIFAFWMLSFSQLFHSLLSLASRGSLVPLQFLP